MKTSSKIIIAAWVALAAIGIANHASASDFPEWDKCNSDAYERVSNFATSKVNLSFDNGMPTNHDIARIMFDSAVALTNEFTECNKMLPVEAATEFDLENVAKTQRKYEIRQQILASEEVKLIDMTESERNEIVKQFN